MNIPFYGSYSGSEELSIKAKAIIEDTNQLKYISIASFWEISIKISLKKLELGVPSKELLIQAIKTGFEILPLTFEHTTGILDLELCHRDPFDRILISQAISENLKIITRDTQFEKYPISIIW
ncbi:type II toxin-antitoxin system VapC family toxin [Pedobacter aquae]|uniref:Type II toxin-antitoxin system VapC family toxin n=1 Tax=Pedobacter aquae TaxID=2605747 RepID=A0A5C0VJF5_9SPHI|nr:type II toxin-antitoxin system VapC family toxin [Pedobacter aquae]QEK52646.1 type II toxin-antitoxin system VapC family toxin [Pedobacter aquae]